MASVKNRRGRGNCIEDVLYEDLVFVNTKTDQQDTKWFRGGIYVDQFYGCEPFDDAAEEPVDEGTPVIRNITFRNIQADTAVSSAIYLVGLCRNSRWKISGWKTYRPPDVGECAPRIFGD